MASAEAKHCRGVEPRRGAGRRDLGTRARASMCRIQWVSFQSKRLRRSVEPRRGAGRRDLGTRVQDSIVGSEYLSPNPERHMGRSLQRNIFDRLCTLQGRERPARSFLSASHPQTVRDSRTPQKISTSPKRQKTSPESTRIMQSETTLCHVRAGALGGSSGRMREAWREKGHPPKGGPFSLQGLLTPS